MEERLVLNDGTRDSGRQATRGSVEVGTRAGEKKDLTDRWRR